MGRWREAVGGEGQIVLLCGEAGIGKSRIARSLCDSLTDERYQTIQFQCSPYHTNTALYPAINYLRQAAGLASQDSVHAQLNKLDVMARESGIGTRIRFHCLRICSRSEETTDTRRSMCHPKHART